MNGYLYIKIKKKKQLIIQIFFYGCNPAGSCLSCMPILLFNSMFDTCIEGAFKFDWRKALVAIDFSQSQIVYIKHSKSLKLNYQGSLHPVTHFSLETPKRAFNWQKVQT